MDMTVFKGWQECAKFFQKLLWVYRSKTRGSLVWLPTQGCLPLVIPGRGSVGMWAGMLFFHPESPPHPVARSPPPAPHTGLGHLLIFSNPRVGNQFLSCSIFFNVYLFCERECAHTQVSEGQQERERESQAGSALSAWSPTWGSNPRTVRSWPEPKSRAGRFTDWAPQAALSCVLLIFTSSWTKLWVFSPGWKSFEFFGNQSRSIGPFF